MASTSLNKLALNGAFWTIFGYGASNALRFASNLILTRLLVPELFGLMALMTTFLMGLELFSDVGIAPSIIQNKRGHEPLFLNTAWTIQCIRGVFLWLMGCLIAYPVSQFYGEPRINWLMPILGLTILLGGFNSTSLATLRRDLNLKVSVILELALYTTSVFIVITWAYFSPTIWALVAGSLITASIRLTVSHWLLPGIPNKFAWDPVCARELFTFGRWIFLSTAFTFLAMQSDRLIIGKVVSIEMLGIYTICLALSDLPRQIVVHLGSNVIFPVISKSIDAPRSELRQKFLKKRWLLLMGSAVLAVALVSTGDLLIKLLYDSRYSSEAWILTILAFGFWHTVLYDTMSSCLMGLGKPYYATIGFMTRFLILLLGVPVAYQAGGFVAAVTVIAFHDLPMYFVIAYGAAREKVSSLIQDLQATAIFLALLALALALRSALGFGMPLESIL